MSLTQTPDLVDNSDPSGTRTGMAMTREAAVGAPRRFIHDYKTTDFGEKRKFRRLPWFVAGLGIPLICVAFILPKTENSIVVVPTAESFADSSLVDTATATPQTLPTTLDNLQALSIDMGQAPVEEPVSATTLTLKIRPGDSLDRIFRRNDLQIADLAEFMQLEIAKKHLRLVRPGDEIVVRHSEGNILQVEKPVSLSETLSIEKVDDKFQATLIARELELRPARTTGTIDSSLFLAAADAGISDRTIMNLAGIFAWDVDFMLDIREGDQFALIYEEIWQDGERLADGEILAAEFINQGESFRAVRFQDASGRVDYYSPDGRSVRKAFVRAPLSFSRISSNFNPNRRHPKLNTIRAHRGVDYAAPTGTPIKAAGDGKIIHRGGKGGYGNTVILQHGGNITTLYAHLSRFAKARNGSRVRQGEIIGYVGATGLATGPHLHYEYRRNGVHMNPRTVKLPEADPINPEFMADFKKSSELLLKQLEDSRNLFAASSSNTTT
jgi:murein DD-endopeptidase MepM/ murein hydrolase activator NlpD